MYAYIDYVVGELEADTMQLTLLVQNYLAHIVDNYIHVLVGSLVNNLTIENTR